MLADFAKFFLLFSVVQLTDPNENTKGKTAIN